MRILTSTGIVVASVIVTLVLFDVALHFTHYKDLIAKYAFPMNYYTMVPGVGRDIKPNQPSTLVPFFDYQYDTWSNEIGCFDTSVSDVTAATPYIYLAGDSFTWGFAPFTDKWGTVIQNEIGTRVLKCGVPGYGTHLELLKTEYDLAKFPTPPQLIIVGYFDNDPFDDSVADPGLQLPVCEVKGMPLRCWLSQNWLYQNSVLYNAAYGLLGRWINPPSLQPTPQMYATNFSNLQGFESYAQAHNSKLLIVLIPPEQATKTGVSVYGPQKQYMDSMHIPYIDLTDELHSYYQPNASFYWKTNPHLDILGNQLVGYLLSQYMITNNIVSVPDESAALKNITQQIQALLPA